MKIRIKVLNNSNDWELHPTYSKAKINGDCGLDIPTPSNIDIPENAKAFPISLGICTEPSCAYMLVPRSSITKTPLRMANSIGIIDRGYRGELIAKVDNNSDYPFCMNRGKCFFQIISFDGILPEYVIVSELSNSKRGNGGFGSSTQ